MPKTIHTLLFFLAGMAVYSCGYSERQNSENTTDVTNLDGIKNNSTFIKVDTLNQIPDALKELIKGNIKTLMKVDFSGDGKPDFICLYEPEYKLDSSDYIQDWISADLKIVKREKKYVQDFDYLWFVNLDNDPEPEIISASGFEDGIDYAFYDQNLKTGEHKLLFFFHPIIIENNSHFWGYPWDITDVILKANSENVFLRSSIDHNIQRDGEITITDENKKMPAIFFLGKSTQPNKIEGIRSIKWATINELK